MSSPFLLLPLGNSRSTCNSLPARYVLPDSLAAVKAWSFLLPGTGRAPGIAPSPQPYPRTVVIMMYFEVLFMRASFTHGAVENDRTAELETLYAQFAGRIAQWYVVPLDNSPGRKL